MDKQQGYIILFLLFNSLCSNVFADDRPNSCADVYTSDITRTSGLYTIYNKQNQSYQVFCDIRNGHGYTYVSPATRVVINVADLVNGNNNSHVLIRDLRSNGKQYVAKVEQISRDARVPLSIQYNAHVNYAALVNAKMAPYMYVGITPKSSIHKSGVHGYRVNGHDITYTNCDGNQNSYFSFLFNQQHMAITSYSSDTLMIHQWVNLASELPPSQHIPNSFFSEFEVHFGGCGGFGTTHVLPQVTGAALGIRYDIACPSPVDIQHGTTQHTSNYMVGSTVTYHCDVGYTLLKGDASRTCAQTGKWTGILPNCGQFPCDSQPCQNGGLCFGGEGDTYVCECQVNFVGQYCQTKLKLE